MNKVTLLILMLLSINAHAQHVFKAIVKDSISQQPIVNVSVSEGKNKGALSSDSGKVVFSDLSAGKHRFLFSLEGYDPQEIQITLPSSSWHVVLLKAKQKELEEVTVIASSRNNLRMENSPLKVEVLGMEELAEENTIKPGNIASLLSDVSGIQIQQSSAVSGNANVRIQGLEGRYTQLLRDGVPLFDGFSGGFGVLQIPPLDLKQVELIKGCASTLYGSGAIGGLINLISKQPTEQQEAVATLNQTSLKESNVNLYAAKRYNHFGYTFFTGLTHQNAADVNKDGFSDVPTLNSVVVHPRIFFYPNEKTKIIAGYTGTFENRLGGDMEVIGNKSDEIHRFFERNNNDRHSGELSLDHTFAKSGRLSVRASLSSFARGISSADLYFKGRQVSYFTEAAVMVPFSKNSVVAGLNVSGNLFKKLPSDPIALTNFQNNTVGAFAQFTAWLPGNSTFELGLRGDHDNFGNFLLPRVALLHRFNNAWATRLGIGLSYKSPNPLAPQNIDYPIETIQPLPAGIKAERSIGYNAEVNYKKKIGENSSLFINQAFFFTEVRKPIVTTVLSDESVVFNNANKSINTKGLDTYIQLTLNDWEVYAGYTLTVAERKYLTTNQFLPLTPMHRVAFTLVKEFEEHWRLGLEGSYTGSQYRDNESKTPGYVFFAAMVERKFGKHVSLVLNAENLLDYRQSKFESLYTGTITNPTFKPLWAPIDGRVVNMSLRIGLL
ncbi:TonB-dependent receptor [Solitalea sp. MAHUQ-68]|uniref:TonB-dependent receptor n=1 Tax=Solitalea agri TaxID=2953739 RepID=A0A9X2F319_9SPHI|nr:TonB-dependent receptor [Solitalea agri]MCO4293331.1 TonB-dependent receptor [Solitalea agri]